MMCEVMPTISEDTAMSQRGSQSSSSDPDSHFEQLMVNMLDERDRLLDTLRETQESLGLAQQHLQDVIYDRDSLQRQLSSALPQMKELLYAANTVDVLGIVTLIPVTCSGHFHSSGELWRFAAGKKRGRSIKIHTHHVHISLCVISH
ncbi:hypothetical protein JOB18_043838 [Solea senegalensis]|uniref:Liprin-alpha-2 n=1 Tax=Solea senegalensis TaxID=28829 RepID=A0AAV6R050_SOLSE|nr:hypothetical protein JOB18_043838 [Solea senegalensis]